MNDTSHIQLLSGYPPCPWGGDAAWRACGAMKSRRHATRSSDPAVKAAPRSPPATPRTAWRTRRIRIVGGVSRRARVVERWGRTEGSWSGGAPRGGALPATHPPARGCAADSHRFGGEGSDFRGNMRVRLRSEGVRARPSRTRSAPDVEHEKSATAKVPAAGGAPGVAAPAHRLRGRSNGVRTRIEQH